MDGEGAKTARPLACPPHAFSPLNSGEAAPSNGYTSLSDAYYKAGPAGVGGGGGGAGGLGGSGAGEAWVEVGRGRSFTPAPDDVGSALRLEVACIDGAVAGAYGGGGAEVGRPVAVATARVRPAPAPPRRALVCLASPSSAPPPTPRPGRFTVLTYNTLADLYAQPDAHPATPPWALAWAYRRQNLVKEVLAVAPDIVCLQEVQSNHYDDWWAPELHRAGYTGVYKKKTGALYTGGAAFAADGCATFFKRGRFALVKKYEVEFNKAALSLADGLPAPARGPALTRLLKDNVALIAVLEALDTAAPAAAASPASTTTPPRRQLVCVANTHIHANPELNDVKLWQVHTLLKGLEKIAASADVPMVLAGDFNSTPGSAAHRLLTTGRVDAGHPDLEGDPLGILRPSAKLAHGLPLASAYAAALDLARPEEAELLTAPGPAGAAARLAAGVDASTGEPVLTNAGRDFRGTLDYILYAADALVPTALLELPVFEGPGGSSVVGGGGGGGGGGGAGASPRAGGVAGGAASSRPPLPPGALSGGLAAPPVVGAAGLPSERWSSDHVALMAEFTYCAKR